MIAVSLEMSDEPDLYTAYYLKEDLRLFWQPTSKEKAELFLKKWLEQADDSGVKHIKQIANTIRLYQWGILNWYDTPFPMGYTKESITKSKSSKGLPMDTEIWTTFN